MATYVVLMNLTEQGVKTIKEAPQRIEDGFKAVEALGGRVKDFYVVMGEYDYVGIGEFSTDEAAMAFSTGLSAMGNVRTTTLKAFTKEAFAEIVKKLP